jgi:hypothetical protein
MGRMHGSFAYHLDHRYNHFFQADAAVLEGVAVIIHIMVVVVGIAEENILAAKNIGRVDGR